VFVAHQDNNMLNLSFYCWSFEELDTYQLYRIMQLRQEVFVVEQDCPYLDADDKDQKSYHVCGIDESNIIQAYTRLVPKGISYPNYISIGRVVNSKSIRGMGYGTILMEKSIEEAKKLWPNIPIKISAQTYLIKFYNSLGFKEIGEEYLEDDLPHIAMINDFSNENLLK